MRKFVTMALVALFAAAGASADDDRFESENKATGVRAGTPRQKSGDKGSKSAPTDKVWKAEEVKELTGLDGKEAVVRGKVARVYVPDTKRLAILNFGKDPKTCFKAVIYARAFEKFDGGLDGIRKFEGKEVVVEGKVSLYEKLPQIVVNVPSQIKPAK